MGAKTDLDAQGLRAQKKFGQHFLTDPRILESIANAGDVSPEDTVLEIGPGLGHLTRVLARRARRVVAVEIDEELATRLKTEFASTSNVTIERGDILEYDLIELAGTNLEPAPPFKVIANLPYYITSAILRHLLEATHKPRVIVVMVQRQVAQRLIARPPMMNLLAVSVQCFAQARIVRTVAAGAFYPRPKVDSAVVRLDVLDTPVIAAPDTARFFDIVRAGFGEKRKQLRNSLAHGLGLDPFQMESILAHIHIDPSRRAETLSLDEWAALCRALPRPLFGEA